MASVVEGGTGMLIRKQDLCDKESCQRRIGTDATEPPKPPGRLITVTSLRTDMEGVGAVTVRLVWRPPSCPGCRITGHSPAERWDYSVLRQAAGGTRQSVEGLRRRDSEGWTGRRSEGGDCLPGARSLAVRSKDGDAVAGVDGDRVGVKRELSSRGQVGGFEKKWFRTFSHCKLCDLGAVHARPATFPGLLSAAKK
jgi:hypothetical protein